MTMTKTARTRAYIAGGVGLIAVAAAIAVAESGSSATPVSSAPASTIVQTRSSDLGQILVDAQGRTLYLFGKDTGAASTCSGACAADWPPVPVVGTPHASGGATAASIGVITASDGRTQLSYAGHPLYYFVGDSSAGQTHGQGINEFGAKWWVLDSSGAKVTAAPSSSSQGNAGGGYTY